MVNHAAPIPSSIGSRITKSPRQPRLVAVGVIFMLSVPGSSKCVCLQCLLAKGCSFLTKERYYNAFKRFCAYLADKFRLQKLENISGKHLTAYVFWMQESGKSPSTIRGHKLLAPMICTRTGLSTCCNSSS